MVVQTEIKPNLNHWTAVKPEAFQAALPRPGAINPAIGDRIAFGSTSSAARLSVQAPEVKEALKSFPEFGPPPLNTAFHAGRRAALMARMPANTTLIVPGASLKLRNGDVDYPFRQESNFHYLTGFDEPDAVAILSNVPGKPKFTLIVPPRDPAMETWTGKRAGIAGAIQKYKADAAYENTQLDDLLRKTLRESPNVLVLPAVANGKMNRKLRWAMIQSRPMPERIRLVATELVQRMVDLLKLNIQLVSTQNEVHDAVNEMRLIKTPYEIALLKRACDISAKGHLSAMKNLRLTRARRQSDGQPFEGRNEGEVQAELEYNFRRHGAERVGYETIAGGGANACVLHYNTNREFAKPGDLELVDAGAEYGYYTADITRTWPISGKFTPEQKAIYDLVLKAQEAGIEMTRPGVTLAQIHEQCARIITEGLVDLGILQGNPETLYDQRAYVKYFMHGTSHMLGMDVHDVPMKSRNIDGVPFRNENIRQRPLRAGMVFTVEPGIYIDPEVARKNGVDPKWWGIGVRIEDDILVTENGQENLSDGVPKTTGEIETLMTA